MGANQSAQDPGKSHDKPTKTCYYEVLEVERNATDDE
jgi:hypothetical protein